MNEPAVEELLRTCDQIYEAVRDAPVEYLAPSSSPDEWSVEEIFEHVRAADSIIAPRVYQVLLRPGAPLAVVDERGLADLVRSHTQPIDDRLTPYRTSRRQLVSVLRSLTQDEWALSGEHESRGQMTILDLVHAVLDHEVEHLAQMKALLSASAR